MRTPGGKIGGVLALLGLLTGCAPPPKPAAPPVAPPAPPPNTTSAPAPSPAAPAAPTKPAAEPQEATLLFPHPPGKTWTMRVMLGGKTSTMVIKARPGDGRPESPTFYLDMSRDGKPVQSEGYRVDEKAVYRVAAGPEGVGAITPAMPVLMLPLQPGSSWEWKGAFDGPQGSMSGEATFKLSGPETVTTPAGRFSAYRVDQEFVLMIPGGKQTLHNAQWLAPNVGLVRQTTGQGDVQAIIELLSVKD